MSYNGFSILLEKSMNQIVEHYDIAILGGGPAGYIGALRAVQLGKTVCIIEKEEVGGACLLHGCIPTKSLLSSSELLYKIQHAEEYGIIVEGTVKPDYPKIIQRKNQIITILINGIKNLLKSSQIPIYYGSGYIKNSKTIEVTPMLGKSRLISTDNIVIATGSRPADIPGFAFDGKRILSTNDILRMTEIPSSLLILGAGAAGCEFAFTFAELGSQITVVEMMPHALPLEDIEISELLERQFRKRKIRLLTNTKLASLDMTGNNRITAHLNQGEPIHADKLLITVGRILNTKHIGLEEIGVKLGPIGEIIVNARMETTVPSIYAAGDVTGKYLLAHVASAQAMITIENICGKNREMDYRTVPWTTFTHPPVSHVGLTEKQCIQKKRKIRIGRFQFRALGAAQVSNELDGMVKIIVDYKSDEILGVHILGSRSTELIHEAVVAMEHHVTAKRLGETIHAHPTLSEAMMEAVHDLHGDSIHIPKKLS